MMKYETAKLMIIELDDASLLTYSNGLVGGDFGEGSMGSGWDSWW